MAKSTKPFSIIYTYEVRHRSSKHLIMTCSFSLKHIITAFSYAINQSLIKFSPRGWRLSCRADLNFFFVTHRRTIREHNTRPISIRSDESTKTSYAEYGKHLHLISTFQVSEANTFNKVLTSKRKNR